MDEFSFIKSIQQGSYRQPSVIHGIGDDAAVFRLHNQDVVTAKDMVVENVHFARNTMEPYHIGYKALAANLSDIAAMGAKPAYYLVAISIPNNWSMEEIKMIYIGMNDLAQQYHVDLIGGDTVSGTELVISITVIGFVGKDKVRLRSHAKEDDIVFVTETLGDSQAGFYILNHSGKYIEEDYFIRRHQLPSPRVEFSLALHPIVRLCLNDISDGIGSEANEIAEASQVSILIEEERLPVHHNLKQFEDSLQYKWKLFGGEDYELIGTVSKKDWDQVQAIAEQLHIRVTKIGLVTSKSATAEVYLKSKNGRIERLDKKGYNHLSR
ncbi:thiamine-phosphate kinase [Ornithinibacillus xuwenensis]|uniref:Thiamine-monophosphate kinase n=1 Tax=Ornithinibacillus xuwenensis TaxID=3144668 RepID=A0ABU9XKK2_9BACI